MAEESDFRTLRLLRSDSETAIEQLMLKYDKTVCKIIWTYIQRGDIPLGEGVQLRRYSLA